MLWIKWDSPGLAGIHHVIDIVELHLKVDIRIVDKQPIAGDSNAFFIDFDDDLDSLSVVILCIEDSH